MLVIVRCVSLRGLVLLVHLEDRGVLDREEDPPARVLLEQRVLYLSICLYMCIYIYIERERDIYIYTYISVLLLELLELGRDAAEGGGRGVDGGGGHGCRFEGGGWMAGVEGVVSTGHDGCTRSARSTPASERWLPNLDQSYISKGI